MPDATDAREGNDNDSEVIDHPLPFDKSVLFWDLLDWKKILTLDTLTASYLEELSVSVDLNYAIDPTDRVWIKEQIQEKLRLGLFLSNGG